MVISNNATAGFILGTLSKNINKKTKAAGQLALGEKIRNAGDDASGYAISERMRVRIRALDQADANVQNGASMLRVAEGAIQSQINLLRTVKAKVIDAHNDTNTDDDRAIIQKEITEYYNEINDIAAETTFNGKHLLLGTKVSEAVKGWFKYDHAEKLEGSDTLGLISGSYNTLDGQEGPFAIFGASNDTPAFDGYRVDIVSTNPMSGGSNDDPNQLGIDFGDEHLRDYYYNKAFKISYPGGGQVFVLTDGNSYHYRGEEDGSVHVVDIHSTSNFARDVAKLADIIGQYMDAQLREYTSDGTIRKRIVLTTYAKGAITNDTDLYNVKGVSLAGGGIYTQADPLPEETIFNDQKGKDGETDRYTMNLSSYNTSDAAVAESFISQYVGQAIYHSGNGRYYEFVDSAKSPSMDSISKINGSTVIDLNQIRSAVSSGKTVSEAFADLMSSSMGSLATAEKNGSGQTTGVVFWATKRGENSGQKISFVKGDLRDYTIDFKTFFSGVSGSDIPSSLDGQGFRFYDASEKNKWVNVLFVNGINPNDDERPPSGGYGMDIDTLVVDVSDVNSVDSLLRTLYMGDGDKNKQGLSQFLGNSSQNFRVAVDFDAGTLTIYDKRRYPVVSGSGPEKGAKIANGIVDNVVADYRNTYVNDLVIQHTDKSSANIHVRIPQTTLDQIFGYKIGDGSLDDYSVMTSEKREFLLGQDYPVKITGALDKGLQYLIDANTLIGAQIVHMEFADANIVTEVENTTAAESAIRDADIAKSAMDMATASILSQSTMAMLSQFNHSSSDVLNLLQ